MQRKHSNTRFVLTLTIVMRETWLSFLNILIISTY